MPELTPEQLTALRELNEVAREALDEQDKVLDAIGEPPPPSDLPVVSIHDATPVQAGGILVFPIMLDESVPGGVQLEWTLGPDADELVSAAKLAWISPLDGELRVTTKTDAPKLPADLQVELQPSPDFTLGQATATGRVLPAVAPPSEPDLTHGLLFELTAPITAPIDLAPFQKDVVTVSLVWDGEPGSAHQKVFCIEDCMNVGTHPAGPLDVWCYAPDFRAVQKPPVFPYYKATWLLAEFGPSVMEVWVDGESVARQEITGPRASAIGKRAALLQGFWRGAASQSPAKGPLVHCRAWERPLIAAERLLEQQAVAGKVEDQPNPPPDENGDIPPPPDGNGDLPPPSNGGQLEPVDPSFLQVKLDAGAEERHVFRGSGYGLNAGDPAIAMLPRFKQYAAGMLSKQAIGANVIRILAPEAVDRVMAAYKPYVDHLRSIGSDPEWIVGTGFVWRGNSRVAALIDGVAECRRRGVLINVVVAQNEPDGNPSNAIAGGPSKYVDYVDEALSRLKHHGLEGAVEFAGLGEWRHPTSGGVVEARMLRDAGLIAKGKVAQGSYHFYDKGPDLELSSIYGKLGMGSWEDGNSGWPSYGGRVLSGINLTSIFQMCHYCIISTPTPNSEQLGQALIDYNGKPRPWWHFARIARELTPGSVVRRVGSDDRPGLPDELARWMIRHAPRGGGYNPRQNAVFAKRKDGKYVLVVVNTTHGENAPNPYTSGHYGGRKQQLTFRAAELAGKRGSFTAWRTDGAGISGPQSYPLVDGQLRFKLGPAEAICLVGGPT